MTIRLPGFAEEIQPGMQGIMSGIQQLINPDMARQLALRQQMLQDPNLQQTLTDMGAARVEEVYGKGTGGFAGSGPKSAKKVANDALAESLPEIFADPVKREEWLANQTGTKTNAERKSQELRTQADELQVSELTRQKESRDHAQTTAMKIHARLGTDPKAGDLYRMSKEGKITSLELQDLLADPVYKSKYENDQQDYWHQITASLEQQRISAMHQGNRQSMDEWKQKLKYTHAQMVADKYGGNPEAIMKMQENPQLVQQYASLTEPPKDPEGLAYYEAAKNIVRMRDELNGKEFNAADKEFRIAAAADFARAQAKTTNPDQKRQALMEANAKARAIYGRAGVKDIPVWHYDDKNPELSTGILGSGVGKNDAFYRVGGDPTLFGTGENYVPVPKGTPSTSVMVEKAAHDVVAGNANLNELLAKAPDKETRTELERRVKELTGGDSVKASPKAATVSGINSGADSTVKANLKIPRDTMNLNVGRDKTDSISKAVTARDLPTTKLIEYMTEGMSGKEKQNATREILAMSQHEKDTIIKELREEGKIK